MQVMVRNELHMPKQYFDTDGMPVIHLDRTYLSRLVAHIIANVQVELSDVQIRYECTEKSIAKVWLCMALLSFLLM